MSIKSFLANFFGSRINERNPINELTNQQKKAGEELRFRRVEFIRIKPEVPAWGGRVAIILAFRYRDGGGGYEYLDNGRTLGYDVLVQDPDDPKTFTRLAKNFVDDEIELAKPEVAEELKGYVEAKTLKMLALGNPLTHELDLMHMPLSLQAA